MELLKSYDFRLITRIDRQQHSLFVSVCSRTFVRIKKSRIRNHGHSEIERSRLLLPSTFVRCIIRPRTLLTRSRVKSLTQIVHLEFVRFFKAKSASSTTERVDVLLYVRVIRASSAVAKNKFKKRSKSLRKMSLTLVKSYPLYSVRGNELSVPSLS